MFFKCNFLRENQVRSIAARSENEFLKSMIKMHEGTRILSLIHFPGYIFMCHA